MAYSLPGGTLADVKGFSKDNQRTERAGLTEVYIPNLSSTCQKHRYISHADDYHCPLLSEFFKEVIFSTDFSPGCYAKLCSLYGNVWDPAIVLLHNKKIQADFHGYLYEFNPKNSAFKPQHYTSLQ